MYFDNSVFDFYAGIFNGAAMAPVDLETLQQPGKLVEYIDKVEATIWFSVPSLLIFLLTMRVLKRERFKKLRVITFGGEGFPKSRLKELYDLFSDRIRFVNVYGPTECTCICSAYDIKASDFDNMKSLAPLGFPAPNFEFIILDEEQKISKSGELLLGGPQVGIGYYNDQEKTEKSFVQHPSIKAARRIMYRTGDLVTEDGDGVIHIVGRIDNQIKYMGYRIELEEIEAAFNTLQYINEAGVIYEKYENGLGEINAFISLRTDISSETVRKDIRKILPPYMIPRGIFVVENLPKNSNGKIDRLELKNLNKRV
jgi:D-alanine--poly(phosphoribitol) ligase subunit 1